MLSYGPEKQAIGGDFGLRWAQPIPGVPGGGVVGGVAGTGRKRLDRTGCDFDPEIADRIKNENRFPIFPELFLNGITIAIKKKIAGSDFKMRIAIRF